MGADLRNIARTLMGQLGITTNIVDTPLPFDAAVLARFVYAKRGKDIKQRLRDMKPETLGKIAACGRGSRVQKRTPQYEAVAATMYSVHAGTWPLTGGGSWLDNHADGMSLLVEIACTAIMAEMGDILRYWTQQNATHKGERAELAARAHEMPDARRPND